MRAAGLDEDALAGYYFRQLRRIESGEKSTPRVPEKMLLDVLKECTKIMFAPARREAALEQPTTVELVHFVPRPEREEPKPPVTPGAGN